MAIAAADQPTPHLLQLSLYQAVAYVHHLPDEVGVVVGGVEITAAPQDEGLVDGVLEAVVGVLGDAVFMALAAIDAGGAEAIVVQQGGVIVVKSAAAAAFHLVGGRRGIVAAHHLWNAAQGPEGILQTLLQRQEGLTGGDLGVAPPRVAEYQLEQQVGVGLSGDGHPEFPAVGEVELGFASRWMLLGEVRLPLRTVERPPIL